MRIPIAESEIGIWYPIGDYYHFVSVESTWFENNGNSRYDQYRQSTYAEFKKEFPHIVRGTGCRSRKKLK